MDDNADKKLSENTEKAAGIRALQQIRKLVDDFEQEDKNNRRKAIVLIAVTLVFAISVFLFSVCGKQESVTLNIDNATLNKP